MTIKCLAIDDEPLALRQLTNYLQKVPFFEVVGSCPSALKAMKMLEETPVDVLFLDINMPDLNGLDFVRSMTNPPLVVFTTAYSEYALDGYEVEAVDYLLKPFGMGKVMAAANKVRKRLEAKQEETDDVIFLKTDYKVVRVALRQIVYVEGMSEYLRFHLAGQARPVVSLLSMKKLEERLDGHGFMRIHKSFIVSLRHIVEVERASVKLDTGCELSVGPTYRAALGDYIASRSLMK